MAQAAALLSRLAPDDLIGDAADVVALRAAGIKLFGRAVLHVSTVFNCVFLTTACV